MKRLYLVNSLIVPFKGEEGTPAVFTAARISRETFAEVYREAKNNGWEIVSAIGHKETAEFLGEIFGEEVEVARREIYLEEGDYSLVVKVEVRAEDPRKIYTVEEMRELDAKGLVGYYLVARIPEPAKVLFGMWETFSKGLGGVVGKK